MKLYAITDGEYSDYGIITLTADEKKAERLAKMLNANVEEYEDGEYDTVLNNEEEIICATYFRYTVNHERLDWVEDMVGAAKKAADIYSKWNAERLGL